jgi:phage baseplate assembly protein W
MDSSNSFLGTGWSFPPEFDRNTGLPEMVSDIKDIEQSLDILLSTSLGERVMLSDYGCDLNNYLFESLNSSVIGYIKDRVENSILFYEPRIVAEKIEVTSDDSSDLLEGKFNIRVTYSIPGTNSRFNYVYGYYQNEALQKI